MKVIVKEEFVDINNGVLCKTNTIIEVTEERFKEINKAGFGILVEEIKEPKE